MNDTNIEPESVSFPKRVGRISSYIELGVIATVLAVAFAREAVQTPFWWTVPWQQALFYAFASISSPNVLSLGAALFVEVVVYLQSGSTVVTLLVRVISERSTPSFTEPRISPLPIVRQQGPRAEFVAAVRRSQAMVLVSERRPTVLMFVGTAIALIGLLFFIATVPGILPGTVSESDNSIDAFRRLIELSPRLLMLVFIQVLAGFFLRQYRISMEELRYYEAVLRSREAQLLAFDLLTSEMKVKASKLVAHILASREFMMLPSGNTTSILEAQRVESNELKGLADRLIDVIQQKTTSTTTN